MAQSAFWMSLCLAAELFFKFVLHLGYPYDYPMPPRYAIFGDFRSYIGKFARFHSRAFFTGPILTYPAPTASLFKIFLPGAYIHATLPTLRYITVILVVSWIMLAAFHRALVHRGLEPRSAALFCAGLYLTSYPLWFEIHQGNIEFAVWVVLALGVWAHCRRRSYGAAICFGIAGALKLFPFLFVGLLIARKQYKQIVVVLLVATVCTLAGLWLLCPDVAYSWRQTQRALGSLSPDPILLLPPVVSGFDHSLWVLVKRCLPTLPAPAHLEPLLHLYFITMALGGCVLFLTRIAKLPVENQVLALTIACILLPPVSYDYTLIHLYIPFALVIFLVLAGDDRSLTMLLVLSLFAFLLSWQSEFIFYGVRFGGQAKSIALLALFCTSVVHPFTSAAGRPMRGPSLDASLAPASSRD